MQREWKTLGRAEVEKEKVLARKGGVGYGIGLKKEKTSAGIGRTEDIGREKEEGKSIRRMKGQ